MQRFNLFDFSCLKDLQHEGIWWQYSRAICFLVGLLYYNTKIKWKNVLSHIHFYCVQMFLQYGMSNFCAPLKKEKEKETYMGSINIINWGQSWFSLIV